MFDTNPNLMDLAREFLEVSLDAKYDQDDMQMSNFFLEQAAQVYDQAGSPGDADACRILIDD